MADSAASDTTYLDLVDLVDSFPYDDAALKEYYKLILPDQGKAQGWIHPDIVKRIPWTQRFSVLHERRIISIEQPAVSANKSEAVTLILAELVNCIVDNNVFRCTGTRHSEMFMIPGCSYQVQIERFATSLFGITTRGAHMTAYTRDASGVYRFWVARRSMKVGHFKGLLDSTVAGGVAANETPFDNVVREAGEEASLNESFVRQKIVPAGVLTYMGLSKGENGWEEGMLMPDIVCVYDMELDESTVPHPCDDEVKDFHLFTLDDVKTSMLRREWKPNSAIVMIDFFIRHGILTFENDHNFVEISQRLHRRLPYS